jgi:dihydrodipicolinate synthase/N-acetylneuraminate lyase
MDATEPLRRRLLAGAVIPAHPLALTAGRRLDEVRQVALTRYYCDAGVGGLAVGVHTTQFAIRDPRVGLLEPVLRLAAHAVREREARGGRRIVMIAGACGHTPQAVSEAGLARDLGYDAVLLSLGGWGDASDADLLAHCREVASVVPLVGFYLQPAVGGRPLGESFWRRFLEIPAVVGIKVAPFNRYRTLDVVRALAAGGRQDDVALYTGNDDNIVADLLTPFRIRVGHRWVERRIVGGLLGHWAVWTRRAVELFEEICAVRSAPTDAGARALLAVGADLTDVNAALFDADHGFAGCLAGIHEALRRQGLLAGRWCLDPGEDLSPGQLEAIDRVHARYPHLRDDEFVAEHLQGWLR